MAAKVPDYLVEPKQRRLTDLNVGEHAWVFVLFVHIDSKGECYIRPDALVSGKAATDFVRVLRDEQGFHIVVDSRIINGLRRDGYVPPNAVPVVTFSDELRTS